MKNNQLNGRIFKVGKYFHLTTGLPPFVLNMKPGPKVYPLRTKRGKRQKQLGLR